MPSGRADGRSSAQTPPSAAGCAATSWPPSPLRINAAGRLPAPSTPPAVGPVRAELAVFLVQVGLLTRPPPGTHPETRAPTRRGRSRSTSHPTHLPPEALPQYVLRPRFRRMRVLPGRICLAHLPLPHRSPAAIRMGCAVRDKTDSPGLAAHARPRRKLESLRGGASPRAASAAIRAETLEKHPGRGSHPPPLPPWLPGGQRRPGHAPPSPGPVRSHCVYVRRVRPLTLL